MSKISERDSFAPDTRYREEALERNTNPDRRALITFLAQRWATTGQWKMRQALGSAAGALIDDSESLNDDITERDPWLSAEAAADLADACCRYLKTYAAHTKE